MIYLTPIIVVFFNCFLGAVAALLLKKGSKSGFLNIDLLNGLFLYGLSAIIFVVSLKYAPVSVLYPITSATYIWSFIFARRYLKESITFDKMLGLSFIILGIFLIAIA